MRHRPRQDESRFDPLYSLDAPCRYRLDLPGGLDREAIKNAIGMVVFTVSVMAFALGLYLVA